MMPGVEDTSGSIAASNTPSQCLYLADPSRFQVLDIKIIAQASIEQSSSGSRLSGGASYDSATSPSKASFPPSSYKSPIKGSSPLIQNVTRSSRPNRNRTDPGDDIDEAASSFNSYLRRTTSHSSASSSSSVTPSRNEQDAKAIHARRVYSLHSRRTSTAGSIPLNVSSSLEVSCSDSWERLGSTQIEYVKEDEEDEEEVASNGRAGVFSAASDGESDDEKACERKQSKSHSGDQLLLKVSPPMQYLRQKTSTSCGIKKSSIFIKADLQIRPSNTAKTSRNTRTSPAGPRTPRIGTISHDSGKPSSIVFVSTDSSQKLFEAVDSTLLRRDGKGFSGPLSSPEAARLEGIDWTSLAEVGRGPLNSSNFEWKWKLLQRGDAIHSDMLGKKSINCACAFVELNPDFGTARILASFSFLVAFPSISSSYEDEGQLSSPSRLPAFQPQSCHHPQLIDRGVGLGICDVETTTRGAVIQQDSNELSPRLRRVSGGLIGLRSSSKARRQVSDTSQEQLTSSIGSSSNPTKVSFQVDFAEICLEDVEEDGPIFRAALANLDRRTVSLKKAAKAIVKAAEEVCSNLCELQASEASLVESMEIAAHLAPSTLGYLQTHLLQQKQREADAKRQEQITLLRDHIVAPLQALIERCKLVQDQSKSFELESRTYYAGTQKWLASGSSAPANGSTASTEDVEVYSSAAIGYDKASSRQDKIDDKQRLRQARFHLARLYVFRAVKDVHGGEAELQLASHFLAVCRRQCPEKESEVMLQSFEKALRVELSKSAHRHEEWHRKYKGVHEQINELHEMLGKPTLDVEADSASTILPTCDAEVALRAKTRQSGNRFINLLTSLANGKNSSTTVLPSSPTKWDLLHSINTVTFATPGVNDDDRLSAKTQQNTRPLSFAAPTHSPFHWRRTSASDSQPATQLSRSASIGSPHSKGDRTLSHSSPVPKRSSSNSGILASPQMMNSSFHTPVECTSTTAVNGRTLGAGRASSDTRMAAKATLADAGEANENPQQQSRRSLLQPRRAAQQSRKKEGILWAMSKPIAGAGGADAPKSASRSQNWRECWVVLSGSGHLGQYAEWKDVKIMELSQPLIDLRFATVREARGLERRFTFEIVTRENRRFFQANNEEEMRNWIKAISFAIESLLNGTSSIRQIDKVARVAGDGNALSRAGDEFGSQTFAPPTIGRHRAFSQSLTDLSTATAGGAAARLFHRGREEVTRKRNSKGSNSIESKHLLALSEGGGNSYSNSAIGFPSMPPRQGSWNDHEQGISNKTPVSGYVQHSESRMPESSSSVATQSAWTLEPDYDRQIEEMVHSSYGGLNQAHRRSVSALSSVSPTRQSSQTSQTDAIIAESPNSSLSTKSTRSKEIVDIAVRPENGYCADCRDETPRWASWSLNGEPRCIFICITCSGHHRGLGVGVSRVKSIDLDDWTEEQLTSAKEWGNSRVNALYEAKKSKEVTVSTSRGKQFWIDKYVNKIWYEEPTSTMGQEVIITTPIREPEKNIMVGSPRWPSSPPFVFVSMSEVDKDQVTRWKKDTGASLSSESSSKDDRHGSLPKVSYQDRRTHRNTNGTSHHRLPRHSNDKTIAV